MSSTAIFFATERSILLRNLFISPIHIRSATFNKILGFLCDIKTIIKETGVQKEKKKKKKKKLKGYLT